MVVSSAALLGACGAAPPQSPPLCNADGRSRGCIDPTTAEAWLTDPEAQIIEAEPTGSGSAGAYILTLLASSGGRSVRYRAKWRAQASASSTNSPRKEVVAYFAQSWFLDPEDYVFPPTRSRCFDLDQYRAKVDAQARATFPQASQCVYGVVSYWLDGVETFSSHWYHHEPVLSEDRWAADPVYRRTLADANLLTYVTANGDTHTGNWVKLETARGERIYLVDSSISLSRMGNLSLSPTEDFANLLVPALNRRSVERLIHLDQARLSRMLSVEHLALRGNTLVSERGFGSAHEAGHGADGGEAKLGSHQGLYWATCSHVQGANRELVLGMTPSELSLVERQLWHLEARHAMGEFELLAAQATEDE